VDNPRFGRPSKYTGELRLLEDEFRISYGAGRTIFVDHMNDLWSEAIPPDWIMLVMKHCRNYPENMYVFQTKNPVRYLLFEDVLPKNHIIGFTLETNREELLQKHTHAPTGVSRVAAMARLAIGHKTFMTMEPIMDFDLDVMGFILDKIRPDFVNIGADSKGHDLEEPSGDKIRQLVSLLFEKGIELREKHNLGRLLK
jgi:protein gp37